MLDIQTDVQKYMDHFKYPYWTMDQMLLKLDEESGELAKELGKKHGQLKKKEDNTEKIGHELSDTLFAVTCIANSAEIPLASAYNNQMRIVPGYASIRSIQGIQNHAEKYGVTEKDPTKLYRNLVRTKGHIANSIEEREKYGTGKLGEYLVDCVSILVAEAHLHDINLTKAWDAKMDIRYGRDKGRFEQKS